MSGRIRLIGLAASDVAHHAAYIAHLALRLLLQFVHRVANGLVELLPILLAIRDAPNHTINRHHDFIFSHPANRIQRKTLSLHFFLTFLSFLRSNDSALIEQRVRCPLYYKQRQKLKLVGNKKRASPIDNE